MLDFCSSRYFPTTQQSRAIAFAETGAVLGLICMAPLMDVCVKELGWRRALWVFGGLMALLLLPGPFAFNPHYRYIADIDGKDDDDSASSDQASAESSGLLNAPSVNVDAGQTDSRALPESEARSSTPSVLAAEDVKSACNGGLQRQASLSPNPETAKVLDAENGGGAVVVVTSAISAAVLVPDGSCAGLAVNPAHDQDVEETVFGNDNANGAENDLAETVNLSSLTVVSDSQPVTVALAEDESDEAPLLATEEQGKRGTAEVSGWKPYLTIWRNSHFRLFVVGSSLWYVCFAAPLTYLVSLSRT